MLKNKIGKCIDCGREGPVIAKRCQYHYWIHRRNVKKARERKDNNSIGQMDIFKKIWAERAHKSFISGKGLEQYIHFFPSLFAHVLSKKTYPRWKLNPENIVLLTPHEHHLYDQGTEEQRKAYEKKEGASFAPLFALREKLRKEY